MEPTIPRGARVRVIPIDRIRIGDVILFQGGERLVLHRVLARLGPLLVHAGDAGGAPSLIRRDRVIARALTPRRAPPLRRRLSALRAALTRSAVLRPLRML
jgi:hypothetical protein